MADKTKELLEQMVEKLERQDIQLRMVALDHAMHVQAPGEAIDPKAVLDNAKKFYDFISGADQQTPTA